MKDYTLENLEKMFKEHSTAFEKQKKEQLDQFKMNYPKEPIPDHLKKDFNISKALACICTEIIKIKHSGLVF